jgi:hypothetical protein
MVKGSCLCGGAQYEINGDIKLMANCHCSMCRKHHGAAFVTFVGVNTADFRWLKGEDLLERYQTSPGHVRAFCRVCGSSLPDPDPGATDFYLPAGTLDDDPGARLAGHIFVGSKAPWVEINDGLPQFDEYPPGFDS